jgi:molecular chaperone GrpE
VSRRGNGHEQDLPVASSTAAAEEPAREPAEPTAAEEVGLEAPATEVDELEALRRERDELREALLRRRAEFENYRRRVERDRGTAAAEAEADILRQILGTVDNLERALAAGEAAHGLQQGVELTHRELMGLLQSLGVETLDPVGERFDPALHQAILHEPAPGFAEGTVAEVYRKGFRHKDRLLRPALVKVASGSGDEKSEPGGDVQ